MITLETIPVETVLQIAKDGVEKECGLAPSTRPLSGHGARYFKKVKAVRVARLRLPQPSRQALASSAAKFM